MFTAPAGHSISTASPASEGVLALLLRGTCGPTHNDTSLGRPCVRAVKRHLQECYDLADHAQNAGDALNHVLDV